MLQSTRWLSAEPFQEISSGIASFSKLRISFFKKIFVYDLSHPLLSSLIFSVSSFPSHSFSHLPSPLASFTFHLSILPAFFKCLSFVHLPQNSTIFLPLSFLSSSHVEFVSFPFLSEATKVPLTPSSKKWQHQIIDRSHVYDSCCTHLHILD